MRSNYTPHFVTSEWLKKREHERKEPQGHQARTASKLTQKQDQRTGKLTGGIMRDILTKSAFHFRGIKVRLTTGEVGRVQEIVETGYEVTGRS